MQSWAGPLDHLSETHKELILEFVNETGYIGPFKKEVRKHYHELIVVPTLNSLQGSIFEKDAKPRELMDEAIDSFLAQAFEEPSLEFVHYQIFSQYYNETEIRELLTFYRTDIGKKTLDQESQLFEDWQKQRYKWAVGLRQRVNDAVAEKLDPYIAGRLAEVE
ncbi:MAG: DUF2059 domain-containing protein [Pseudomonadota bacterium]